MVFKRFIILALIFLFPACAMTIGHISKQPLFKALNENGGARIIQKGSSMPIENARALVSSQFFVTDMPYCLKKPEKAVSMKLSMAIPESARHTVYFDLNSSSIAPDEIVNLDKFITLMKRLHAGKVSVTGYTCWLGSPKYNQDLAFKRAKAVSALLKKSGIDIASITGKGKCCYVNRKNPRMDRRVEIQVVKGGDFLRGG